MKKYNVKNYIRYKEDVKQSQPVGKFYDEYTRDELIIKFLPLVENIGRKFATSQEASGVMSIMDIIQEGSLQLCKAVDKIDWEKLMSSDDIEKTLKSFLAKRIRGGIRRAIDKNRGTMRIPEHKINEMRKGKDEKMVRLFFNSIFLSFDAKQEDEDMIYQIPDKSDPYNEQLLNAYLMGLLTKHLEWHEMFVLSKSYGLDGPKWSAKEIASKLKITGISAYVRVSEIKKKAVEKLIANVDHSQVLDYL
ncbi:MAG: sigma-70 family RNA polymerase sigma factor [Ilumatobacteraceae bacterium]|nr:sigma-70 family RNA polymerase sigma factor [Ilumatobacteraceae bacterium]